MALDLAIASSGKGPASRLSAECKLLCLALLSSSALLSSWILALALCLTLFMLLLASGLKPSRIARESLFVAVFAAATFGLKKIGAAVPDTGAIARESGVFGLKLLAAFFLGRLFYASTRISEIRDAITRIMRLIPFARRYDLGLALALILSYVPLIGREWSESSQAMQARGMSNFANPRNVSCFISSMLRRLMIEAVDLPLALYARGWHRDRALSKLTWKKLDSFALSLSFILLFMTALRLV